MVILKKLRASSLVETLTASVIIVVVFMIASLSFNNVFINTIKFEKELLNNRLYELEYFSRNDKIDFPFFEEHGYWIISGKKIDNGAVFNITNTKSKENYNIEMVSK